MKFSQLYALRKVVDPTTSLLVGSLFQSLLLTVLPLRLALIPTLALLAFHLSSRCLGITVAGANTAVSGRWAARLPQENGELGSDAEVVVFAIGASSTQ